MFLIYGLIVSLFTLCGGLYDGGEDYVNSVLNMLLSGDFQDDSDESNTGDQPFFDSGIWKCGNCDVIDETKNVYSEENTVTANGIDEEIEIQVAVSVPGTQCITITAGKTSSVLKVAGSCAGDSVTLSVKSADHFKISAYAG